MAPSTESVYPMRGYIYRLDGYHEGAEYLKDRNELARFMVDKAGPAIEERREVMVTDCWDLALFHSKDGVVLWNGEETS